MSNSNSESSSTASDQNKSIQNIKKPKIIVQCSVYKLKKDGRMKEGKIIISKGFSKTPFGKHYGYSHGNSGSIFDVSLPCPVESCRFDGFSKIYDKYIPELKHCLVISNNKHSAINKMKFGWVDRLYNADRKECWRATKRVIKLNMATHFARMQ